MNKTKGHYEELYSTVVFQFNIFGEKINLMNKTTKSLCGIFLQLNDGLIVSLLLNIFLTYCHYLGVYILLLKIVAVEL